MSQSCWNCGGRGKYRAENARTGEYNEHECQVCKGTGRMRIRSSTISPWRKCPNCINGRGWKIVVVGHYPSGKEKTATQYFTCSTCNGTGKYYNEVGNDIRDLEADV